jgi:nitrate/nitrite transporter NarK
LACSGLVSYIFLFDSVYGLGDIGISGSSHLRYHSSCLLSLWCFGPMVTDSRTVFFVTSYAVSIGISTEFSFYLVSIMNAASLFGRMSGGWLADKYGPFNVICMAGVSSAVVGYCWTAATSYGSLTVWAVAYGYSAGVCPGRRLLLQG